ncbi:MAG: formate dehydrogenase accessory sulfurtransferase FdhD [Planctomycetes bacterium]|nr:formate dehydrogenase accessory sulfurtransferase FdhD [Planctomycetota bacterium]
MTPASTSALTAGSRRYLLPAGGSDLVAVERPLVLKIGGTTLVTMRTPGDEKALGVGFLASEGIVRSVRDVSSCLYRPAAKKGEADTLTIRLRTPSARRRLGALSRVHEIRASCGVCGSADVSRLLTGIRPLAPGRPRVERPALARMERRMRRAQRLFPATGGCHAAAIFSSGGALWACREDIGRHNALDKAIGTCLRDRRDLSRGVVLLSGRGGYELVIKSLRVGIAFLATVGAPSSLAIDLARGSGATLMRLPQRGTARIYHDTGRVA